METPKPKFYETEEFKKLNAKWKKKLETSGFEDIEHEKDYLKRPASGKFNTKTEGRDFQLKHVYYQSVEEYYRLAGQFFHDYPFKDNKEKCIWELHKDGISIRDSLKILRAKRFKVYKDFIEKTIQRLAKEMLSRASVSADGQE